MAGKRCVRAGCAAVLAALLLVFCPLPAAAENAQAVRGQLQYLQRANIQYEWLPDIRASESAVQTLLDLFLACPPEEKAAFTPQEEADLRGYFRALYEVQDKDPDEADALFATEESPPSSAPGSSAPREASSSQAPSSQASSSRASSSQAAPSQTSASQAPASQPAPSSAGAARPASERPPIPTTTAESPPVTESQPAATGEGAGDGLFGSSGVASVLLAALGGLAALLFVRFLAALRKAPRPPAEQSGQDARAQELFGEDYLPEELPAGAPRAPEAGDPPAPPAHKAPGAKSVFDPPQSGEEGGKKRRWFGRVKEDEIEIVALEGDAADAPASPVPAGEAPAPAKEKTAGEKHAPTADENPAPQGAPHAKAAQAGRNPPDKPNSITMRSFGGQPRTGRPAKMPFRQGDPGDLDAIDE